MRRKKKNIFSLLVVLILMLGLGYAFLTQDLTINGTSKVKGNNWSIHFDNVQISSGSVALSTGDVAASIDSNDDTVVNYTITLKTPGDFYEFTVDAVNDGTVDGMIEEVVSKLNGVVISPENPLPDYLIYSIAYSDGVKIDDNHLLRVGETVTYRVRLEFKKDISNDQLPITAQSYDLSFSLNYAQASSVGISKPPMAMILPVNYSCNDNGNCHIDDERFFRSETYLYYIKTVTLGDEISPPDNVIESWDIGVHQNGDVMAYITANASDNTKYDLYIQGDGALYANTDSSFMFANLYVDEINNIEVLDTSLVSDMKYMFSSTGWGGDNFYLNLGPKFDTSKVTNMSNMFNCTGYEGSIFTLDLGNNFDTSQVTDMSGMFENTGFSSPSFTLDLGDKFDTSKVTDMSSMFRSPGGSSFTLDLGDKFDTSNVIDMNCIFMYTGSNNSNFTLNLGNKFDTSKVTNMGSMFYGTGLASTVFTLTLGDKFDTSKVEYMNEMFQSTGYSSSIFTLNLGSKFNTSNVENMRGMFDETGYSNTSFTLDLGDKFDTSNITDMTLMFNGTGHANVNFELDLSTFNFTKVSSYYNMFYTFPSTGKIWVKDVADQTWAINHKGNAPLSTSNVLIKGA